MELLDDCELEEECKGKGHDGGAVAGWKWNLGFYHGSAESVTPGGGPSFVFVWFSIGFFLSLAFQGSADLPYAAVADVFWVPSGGASDGDEGLVSWMRLVTFFWIATCHDQGL